MWSRYHYHINCGAKSSRYNFFFFFLSSAHPSPSSFSPHLLLLRVLRTLGINYFSWRYYRSVCKQSLRARARAKQGARRHIRSSDTATTTGSNLSRPDFLAVAGPCERSSGDHSRRAIERIKHARLANIYYPPQPIDDDAAIWRSRRKKKKPRLPIIRVGRPIDAGRSVRDMAVKTNGTGHVERRMRTNGQATRSGTGFFRTIYTQLNIIRVRSISKSDLWRFRFDCWRPTNLYCDARRPR